MNRKLGNQAASYVLAALLLSMLVTFITFDLKAVRREASFQNEDKCSVDAACTGRAIPTMWGVRGVLAGSAE